MKNRFPLLIRIYINILLFKYWFSKKYKYFDGIKHEKCILIRPCSGCFESCYGYPIYYGGWDIDYGYRGDGCSECHNTGIIVWLEYTPIYKEIFV